MIDPFQCASIQQQIQNKKKKNFAFLNSLVGMIVAVAGLYIVDVFFNIIMKKPFKEIFKVRSTWQAYYASIIAGGINGILVVYLSPKVYSTTAVIILTIIYETIAKMTGLTTLNNLELTRNIVRDIFLINLVLYIFNRLRNKEQEEQDDEIEDIELGELIDVTLISAIIINLTIVSSRLGINTIFGFE